MRQGLSTSRSPMQPKFSSVMQYFYHERPSPDCRVDPTVKLPLNRRSDLFRASRGIPRRGISIPCVEFTCLVLKAVSVRMFSLTGIPPPLTLV